MSTEAILKNVYKHISLTEVEMQHFVSLLQYKKIPRKTVLLHEGQACHYLSYVHSGVLRAYHIDKDGKESTIMFAVDDWWITDMYCFLNHKPAMMYIEAIADSCIYQITKASLDKLFTDIPKFERFFRILMQTPTHESSCALLKSFFICRRKI